MKKYDLIIIGGGPAGMAAAKGAFDAGIKDILILERQPRLGGILNQCIHVGFGLKYFKSELTGTEYAARYEDLLRQTGVKVQTSCFVYEISKDKKVSYLCSDGDITVSADKVVIATGCRERTREMLTVPGTRPAGIYTAGLAQEMINIYGVIPGRDVVIVGSGDIGLIMARRLTLEGARVRAVLEVKPELSGLIRNKIQCLDDFGIPLLLEHQVLEIYGKNRVEKIRYIDHQTGKENLLDCDTILFSVGLIPERDLLIDSCLEPGDGFYLAGNADFVYDLVDNVTKEAEALGREIA